jgi:hypothetical protein
MNTLFLTFKLLIKLLSGRQREWIKRMARRKSECMLGALYHNDTRWEEVGTGSLNRSLRFQIKICSEHP